MRKQTNRFHCETVTERAHSKPERVDSFYQRKRERERNFAFISIWLGRWVSMNERAVLEQKREKSGRE